MRKPENTNLTTAHNKPGTTSGGNRLFVWLKRFGVGGFVFFLVKGLLWLLVPYVIAKVW